MPHFPKPWLRAGRGWYARIDGRQVKLGDDQEAAFERYHELMLGRRAEELTPADYVGEVISDFLAWTARRRSAGTFQWHTYRCESFWSYLKDAGLRELPAADLKPLHVEAWIAAHPTWSPTTIRGMIQSVSRAFRWAKAQKILAEFPLDGLEKPAAERRDNPLSPEAFEKLLGNVKDAAFRDLLTAVWDTGCRPQEIIQIEARHFTGEAWTLPRKEAKGKRKTRVIHLTPRVIAMTRRLADDRPTGPIFLNTRGRPWTAMAFNCRFVTLQKKVGTKFAMVDLRHGFVTRLLKAKVDPITVSALAGHSDLSMVANVYEHVSGDVAHLQAALKATGT